MKPRAVFLRFTCMGTLAIVSVCLPATASLAENPPPPRLITTTGRAEIKVVPDQSTISIAVKTEAKVLPDALADNNEITKKVLAVTAQYKIDPKKVRTANETIEPHYESDSYGHAAKQTGYRIEKTLCLETNPITLEGLITELIAAGANRVYGITFSTSRLRELKDRARLLALRAAREKAQAMAAEFDQKITVPWKIEEVNANSSFYPSALNSIQSSQNASEEAGDHEVVELGSTSISLGTVSVPASVVVSFELQ